MVIHAILQSNPRDQMYSVPNVSTRDGFAESHAVHGNDTLAVILYIQESFHKNIFNVSSRIYDGQNINVLS